MPKSIKIAKVASADVECHFLTFSYWTKGKKHRVYITDYKGRTLGYIDLNHEDKVVIEDRQGSTQEEIDKALDTFMEKYLDRVKAKYGLTKSEEPQSAPVIPQKPVISKGMRIRQQLLERTNLYEKPEKRNKAIFVIENAFYPDSWWEENEQALLLGKMSAAIKLVKRGYAK